jgi:hypothetical protein
MSLLEDIENAKQLAKQVNNPKDDKTHKEETKQQDNAKIRAKLFPTVYKLHKKLVKDFTTIMKQHQLKVVTYPSSRIDGYSMKLTAEVEGVENGSNKELAGIYIDQYDCCSPSNGTRTAPVYYVNPAIVSEDTPKLTVKTLFVNYGFVRYTLKHKDKRAYILIRTNITDDTAEIKFKYIGAKGRKVDGVFLNDVFICKPNSQITDILVPDTDSCEFTEVLLDFFFLSDLNRRSNE